jgi:hypothetical protein
MAKVTTFDLHVKNEAGERWSSRVDVSVNSQGVFSCPVPEDLLELACHRAKKDPNVGQYGVDTKVWIITNPNEAVVAGVSFLLVWFILKLSSGMQYSMTYWKALKNDPKSSHKRRQ